MASAKDRDLPAQIDAAAERDKQKRLLDEIMRPRPLEDDCIIAGQIHNRQDWAGCQCVSLTAALNYQAWYEDNMVYKF